MKIEDLSYKTIFKGGLIGCLGLILLASLIIFLGAFYEVLTEDDQDTTPAVADSTSALERLRDQWKEKSDSAILVQEALEENPYEELNGLIGLEAVKEEIHSLANFARVQQARKEKGLKTPKLSFHLVFTGSPGTGKTTVARIIARIYKDLGILKRGHTVECDRSDLVAKYMGQTAIKTNHVIDSALNGVLFIDEAYSLTPENATQDYGLEAISTLLKRMEDDRDKLVVIIAGYPEEMKRFINANPGLQSRFTRYINFPDYTGQELFDIFTKVYMKKNQYALADDGAADLLRQRLDHAVSTKGKNFGNARYARNVFEKAIQMQANRLSGIKDATEQQLTELTSEDLRLAFDAF
ncbi:MAG: AAA family ATPase [Prevotella sp.]|nr:AAA family ATPase [Prevotella sp.]